MWKGRNISYMGLAYEIKIDPKICDGGLKVVRYVWIGSVARSRREPKLWPESERNECSALAPG